MAVVALFIDLLTQAPEFYFSVVIAVVLSVVLHELAHGATAIWQGDDTPRITGHMTWNPLVHMGGFSLFLLFFAGIAFGQMPVSPHRFRSRYGNAMVAAAGPLANLLLALVGLTIFGLWIRFGGLGAGVAPSAIQHFFFLFGMLNIVLCVFNMLPIPPLDGSTVLADFSPHYRQLTRNPNNQPFFMGAFLLVFFFADWIFATARTVAWGYLDLIL